jgi:hypothetical protein
MQVARESRQPTQDNFLGEAVFFHFQGCLGDRQEELA